VLGSAQGVEGALGAAPASLAAEAGARGATPDTTPPGSSYSGGGRLGRAGWAPLQAERRHATRGAMRLGFVRMQRIEWHGGVELNREKRRGGG
jgi:hypothetical protein